MSYIFRASTNEGYTLKTLVNLLLHIIKDAYFELDQNEMRLRMMNNSKTILIDIVMQASNFRKYSVTSKNHIGINVDLFNKIMETVKKNDLVEFFIDENKPQELGIKIIPKEDKTRITTSYIRIQDTQNIEIELPTGYSTSITIKSSEFQKICKEFCKNSKTIHITSFEDTIRFNSDNGIIRRETVLGCDEFEEKTESKEPKYDEFFDSELLSKIIKLTGLSTSMQIFTKKGNPLYLRSDIGKTSLGKISLFLKSNQLREAESYSAEEEEND